VWPLVETLGLWRPKQSARQRVELSGLGGRVFSELALSVSMDCGVGLDCRNRDSDPPLSRKPMRYTHAFRGIESGAHYSAGVSCKHAMDFPRLNLERRKVRLAFFHECGHAFLPFRCADQHRERFKPDVSSRGQIAIAAQPHC
jgi:hypothetical protein